MHPDIPLGVVTMVMAVLGAIVSLYAPARLWQKSAYASAFGMLGAFGMYFIVRQSNETAIANTNLTNALSNLSSATTQIQKSNDAAARAQEMNTQLERKLLDSNITISNLARRGIDTSTGGNSFCYLEFASLNGAMGQAFAISHGQYPLYGVTARVVDLHALERSVKQARQPDSGVTYGIGDMTYIAAFPLANTIPFSDPESQDFNIFFTARNGFWMEELRLRKVNGRWFEALRVMRSDKKPKKEEQIYELVNKGFPPTEIDWKR